MTRKELLTTLYAWYIDYKKDRGVTINYDNYIPLDNQKYFKDVDLESDFGKALSYFAHKGAFSKNEYFNPDWKVSQKVFFIVMRRLQIMSSLQNCKNHKICEKESDLNSPFVKGTYYKYVSKILDRSLRKYYNKPSDYLEAGYKPLLATNYRFPLKWQTLNGCYAFSVRNILKYKNGIGIYIPRAEKLIDKEPTKLWYYDTMKKFDDISHVEVSRYYHLDTFINSLQAGEPLAITYYLDYYSYKEQKTKSVLHIVAAYSFDKDGVWVAETVKAQRVLVPWEKVFNVYGTLWNKRMFKYDYIPKSQWSQAELDYEKQHNILAGEY